MLNLRIDGFVDERKDPIKSTYAAARYLKAHYQQFGNWHLAMAAYNAGPGTISRALRKTKRKSFWAISKTRYLKSETKNYVPKILAAMTIGENPEKYGFHIDHSNIKPFPSSYVVLNDPIQISELAKELKISSKTLRKWNPELQQDFSPPNKGPKRQYRLRLPKALRGAYEKTRKQLSLVQFKDVKLHRIKRGETLTSIARKYRVSLQRLKRYNPRLNPRRLRLGRRITVPITNIIVSKRPKSSSKI